MQALADMLATLLANRDEIEPRLNPMLEESDIAATIKTAIEIAESTADDDPATLRATLARISGIAAHASKPKPF